MTIRGLPSVLVLCLALAACGRPAQDAADNAQAGAGNNALAAEEADNATESAKSILRPEVATNADEPDMESVHAVIGFGASGLKLDEAGRKAVDALLASPALKAGGAVTLRGHSDSQGSDGDNRVASRIRAEAVRDYLVEKGVAKDRITLIPLGETRPVVPNAHEDGSDDPEARAKNRRVEVDIAPPVKVAPPPVAPTLPKDAKARKEER